MKRICTSEENNLLNNCGADVLTYPGMFSQEDYIYGEQFWVNGGTVTNYVAYSGEDAWLTIAEDDLTNAIGNYCCVKYPVPAGLNIQIGERVILVYSDNGAYIPMKVTEHTKQLIPMQNPEYFESVDWNVSVKIPHPAVLELDQRPRLMNEQEIENFVENGKRAFPGFLGNLKAGSLKKVRYKKKVLFLGENNYTMFRINGIGAKNETLRVYEYKDGELQDSMYNVKNTNFLPEDVVYGTIICKYTVKENTSEWGENYFALQA